MHGSRESLQSEPDSESTDESLIPGSTDDSIDITDSNGNPLTIENFNGSFAATNLGIEGFSPTGQIDGVPLFFAGVQPVGIFTALVQLRDALLGDDAVGINAAGKLVDESQKKLLETRAEAGARLSSLDLTKNRVITEKMELERLVSSTRDIDFAEAATRFQIQQTVKERPKGEAVVVAQTPDAIGGHFCAGAIIARVLIQGFQDLGRDVVGVHVDCLDLSCAHRLFGSDLRCVPQHNTSG